MDKYGFPRTGPKQSRVVYGFQTGDIVRADVPVGVNTGTHIGRVSVRASGGFSVTTAKGVAGKVSYRYCQRIHRSDGYHYTKGKPTVPPHA
jgi:hypothetical protein